MPRGNIVLTNGKTVGTSGGCLACLGRYSNKTVDLKKKIIANSDMTSDQCAESFGFKDVAYAGTSELKRADVSPLVSHLDMFIEHFCGIRKDILDKKSERFAKMSTVFHELANNSVWSDAFLTKSWDEIEGNGEACSFNTNGVSSEFMISAISMLRRTAVRWTDTMYDCIVSGLNFQQAYFYAVLVDCQDVRDWIGDEQIMDLSRLGKARLKAFLEGDYLPADKEDKSYAEKVGYSQTITEQWKEGTRLDGGVFRGDKLWTTNLGANPLQATGVTLTETGAIDEGTTARLFDILNGKYSPSIKANTHIVNILGITEYSLSVKVEKGMFGRHLVGQHKTPVDYSTGVNYLMQEFLA